MQSTAGSHTARSAGKRPHRHEASNTTKTHFVALHLSPRSTGQPPCSDVMSFVLLSGLSEKNSRAIPFLGLTASPWRPHSAGDTQPHTFQQSRYVHTRGTRVNMQCELGFANLQTNQVHHSVGYREQLPSQKGACLSSPTRQVCVGAHTHH